MVDDRSDCDLYVYARQAIDLVAREAILRPRAFRLELQRDFSESLTRIVAALEKDRLILRTRSDSDRREISIAITKRGERVLTARSACSSRLAAKGDHLHTEPAGARFAVRGFLGDAEASVP
jgi:hypothetical protein